MNLLEYKRDNHNRDYFRAVRNDNSITKRVGTYALSSVVVGGLAGAVFLLPAIGPLVATPTLFTALSYSGNLALAGIAGGAGYGIHRAILRKDNKLAKAEKKIQKAAKIENTLNRYRGDDRAYISDRKYARLSKSRDRKVMYFDTVHDMYHRKVDKLATKLGYKLSDEYIKDRTANPFVAETDPNKLKKQGSNNWLNARREKKLIKNFEKLDDLHEDYLDYLGISGNNLDVVEDYSNNLDQRRVINRTKRGYNALKNKVFNPESAAERAKRREEAQKTGTSWAFSARERWANFKENRRAKADAREEERVRLEAERQAELAERAEADRRARLEAERLERERQARQEAERDAQPEVTPEEPELMFEDGAEDKNVYPDGYINFDDEEALMKDDQTSIPYSRESISEMPLFDQIVASAQIVASNRDRLNLVKRDGDVRKHLQPRFVIEPMTTKYGYMRALQKESISNAPYPISSKNSLSVARDYYEKSGNAVDAQRVGKIDTALSNMDTKFQDKCQYLRSQGVDAKGNGDMSILVQLDFDNPKCSTVRQFNDMQEAVVYTQFIESTARGQMKTKNCDAYRITTWSKEGDKSYAVSLPFSAVVTDKATMEETRLRMQKAYLDELYNLYRNAYVFDKQKTKNSTTEIIKEINSATGATTSEKEIVQLVKNLPTFGADGLLPNDKGFDSEVLAKRNEKYMKEQFCRNPDAIKC